MDKFGNEVDIKRIFSQKFFFSSFSRFHYTPLVYIHKKKISFQYLHTHTQFQCLDIKFSENMHILFLRNSWLVFVPWSSHSPGVNHSLGEGAVKPACTDQSGWS